MTTVVVAAAIIAMILVGVALIHRLNARQQARTAAYHYGDTLPGVGRPHRPKHPHPGAGESRSPGEEGRSPDDER
ncbi:hypothetical protein [Streptomyces jumonjinensis]|uniref:Uncharacterized protein n=1 Tax=Streptomyces jumonjinensis TaxID=1945 RepID=A0A646KI90_STRJU|nr:hypothetical protein [Streptomyces jumonjinensis]MQT01974.1 hypothetical protein [Streptomyces jumonjinensis]